MNLGIVQSTVHDSQTQEAHFGGLPYVRKHNFHTVLDLNMVMSTFVVGYAVPTLVYEFRVVLVVLRSYDFYRLSSDQRGQTSRQ